MLNCKIKRRGEGKEKEREEGDTEREGGQEAAAAKSSYRAFSSVPLLSPL